MSKENTAISRMTGEYWKKRAQNFQAWVIFWLIFTLFIGFGGFVSLYVYRRIFKLSRAPTRRKIIWYSTGAVFSFLCVLIALAAEADPLGIVLVWYVTQLFTPTGAGIMEFWRMVKHFFIEETTEEQAQRELARTEKEELAQASKAREQSIRGQASQHVGRLNLGVIEKGDTLPAHAPLTYDNGWLLLDQKVLSQHMFVLGAPGAGKTEFLKRLVVETLRASDRDVFVIDGKGERAFAQDIANLIYSYRKRSVPMFRFGFGQDELSSVYNGFLGRKDAIQNRLLALIGVEEMTGNAQYYADINRDLVQLICGKGHPQVEPPRSFEEVRNRCSKAWLLRSYPMSEDQADIEAIPNDAIEGLKWRLRHLTRDFTPYIDPNGFTLDNSTGAVFSINTLSVGDSAKRFLNFFVEDMKDWIATRKDPDRPGLLIIDEFGAFGNKNIIALLSLARSMGLGVVLATQDVSTIADVQTRDRILGNSVIKVIMRNDQSQEVANLAGTEKHLLLTVQSKDGDPTGMGSARFEDVFKVHPNDVARLLPGQCYVVYNRYATKVHTQMVGAVTYDKTAIKVYRKPTTPQQEEETEPENEPGQAPVQQSETTIYDQSAHIALATTGSASQESDSDEI
jgi:hypothetical protein